ncbi:MAG: HEAT repeat domain-containing protein [Verrucomicrobiae bacterium]|nr:HEAT repeat domain-containing protein [Verrucomicrobiae bacterium]
MTKFSIVELLIYGGVFAIGLALICSFLSKVSPFWRDLFKRRGRTLLVSLIIAGFAAGGVCKLWRWWDEKSEKEYSSRQIASTDAETFFKRLKRPEKGYHHCAAIWALSEKAQKGGAAETEKIVNGAIEILQDRSRSAYSRWPCCYVLSGIGDVRALPALKERLMDETEEEVVRSCAACALSEFKGEDAREILEQAAKEVKCEEVMSCIKRYLPVEDNEQSLDGWNGGPPDAYQFGFLNDPNNEGKKIGHLKSIRAIKEGEYGVFATSIRADAYLGKRVRLSANLQSKEVKGRAGLWFRVDGDGKQLSFDNMANRPVKGTTEWQRYELVVDAPAESKNIIYGLLLDGEGEIQFRDLQMETVGKEVSTTGIALYQRRYVLYAAFAGGMMLLFGVVWGVIGWRRKCGRKALQSQNSG